MFAQEQNVQLHDVQYTCKYINTFMNWGYIISQLGKYTQAHLLLINTMPIFYLLKPSELAHRHWCFYIAHLIIQMHAQRFGILIIIPHSLYAFKGCGIRWWNTSCGVKGLHLVVVSNCSPGWLQPFCILTSRLLILSPLASQVLGLQASTVMKPPLSSPGIFI